VHLAYPWQASSAAFGISCVYVNAATSLNISKCVTSVTCVSYASHVMQQTVHVLYASPCNATMQQTVRMYYMLYASQFNATDWSYAPVYFMCS